MNSNAEKYRAESLSALWLQNHEYGIDDIVVKPQGTFARSYSEDVLKVVSTDEMIIELFIAREGLYDMLPEGIFHHAERKTRKEVSEVIRESKRFRHEEREARKFFLPLEQEFYRQKIEIESIELSNVLQAVNSQNYDSFLKFWGIKFNIFSHDQCSYLLSLLPRVHAIVGNNTLTKKCLQVLLEQDIDIQLEFPAEELVCRAELLSGLGNCILGTDMVIGDSWIDEGPILQVKVGPVPLSRLSEFIPGGMARRQLEVLYGFFFPAETTVQTSIVPDENKDSFILTNDKGYAKLGFTTFF